MSVCVQVEGPGGGVGVAMIQSSEIAPNSLLYVMSLHDVNVSTQSPSVSVQ